MNSLSFRNLLGAKYVIITLQYNWNGFKSLNEIVYGLQVRDELEQLLDDDDDMAYLYLSRKLVGASPTLSSSGAPEFLTSPNIISKTSKTSRASATTDQDDNDVEELEMLLEVSCIRIFRSRTYHFIIGIIDLNRTWWT